MQQRLCLLGDIVICVPTARRQAREAGHCLGAELDRLNREAVRRGLLLGVENRFHPHEIPVRDEIGTILREFAGGAVRYWHDVGHALNHQRLGLTTQQELLEAYGQSRVRELDGIARDGNRR